MTWLAIAAVLTFVGVHLLMHRGHGSHGGGTGHAGHGAARPVVPPMPTARGPGSHGEPPGVAPASGEDGPTTTHGSRTAKGHCH
jgi:hypothetical protein